VNQEEPYGSTQPEPGYRCAWLPASGWAVNLLGMDARSRRHFAAVARASEVEHRERLRQAGSADFVGRMREGLDLAAPFVGRDAAVEAASERRALGQVELHRRWRRLRSQSG